MMTGLFSLRKLPIERLKPASYNPRVTLGPGMPGYEKLKRSLEEFDLVQPIVWNKRTGHVVSGHQRLTILKERGVTVLEVVEVDLPLEREKALNLTLNNPGVGGEWEVDRLLDVLGELVESDDLDATLTGFTEAELNQLLLSPNPDFVPDDTTERESDTYRVTFEIPAEDWEEVRPDLDRFLSTHKLTPHIKEPG